MLRAAFASFFVTVCCILEFATGAYGSDRALIDSTSFIAVIVIPFIYQCILFGIPGFSAVASLFSGNYSAAGLATARGFLSSWIKSVWLFSVMCSILYTIQLLIHLDDPSTFGSALAVALLCPLYAILFHLLVLHPLQARAHILQ